MPYLTPASPLLLLLLLLPRTAPLGLRLRRTAAGSPGTAEPARTGTPAPSVHEEEEELPRKTRRILAQLRSGYCHSLNDYRHRVGLSNSDICPCCGREEHSVRHIFECLQHPTDLRLEDLWLRPVRVAEFLRTLPFFELPAEPGQPPGPPPSNNPNFI